MRIVPILLAAILVVGVDPAAAQAPPLTRLGSVPLPGPATALAAGAGDVVAAAVGSRVLVIDVSRPEAPAVAAAYDLDQPVTGLAAVGRAVYAGNSHDGLRRFDLSNPSAPALTGTVPTRGQAVGVAASGSRVFVGDNSLGFDIVDAAGAMQRVGEYLADGFPRGIAAAGSHVFVADQPAGLIVVDVSDPTSPAVVGRLSLGRDPITRVFAPDARSAGGGAALVCIVSGRAGLQVVDVSDPSAPAVTAAIPAAGRLADAALWDRRLYVAGDSVLQVFDLADPVRPALVGEAHLGGRAGPVAVSGALVFAATPDALIILGRE